MTEQIMDEQNISNDKFGLWKKWFWIGIVMAIANVILGLFYGIALAIEKDHRKEGIIIIILSIVWFIFVSTWLYPQLINWGVLTKYSILKF